MQKCGQTSKSRCPSIPFPFESSARKKSTANTEKVLLREKARACVQVADESVHDVKKIGRQSPVTAYCASLKTPTYPFAKSSKNARRSRVCDLNRLNDPRLTPITITFTCWPMLKVYARKSNCDSGIGIVLVLRTILFLFIYKKLTMYP